MRRITVEQFNEELNKQGVPPEFYAFKCPRCKTIQNARDFINFGMTKDRIEKYLGFSCIGRFKEESQCGLKNNLVPGKGCDWTLGGLFSLHELEVETPEMKIIPLFELATPKEARIHMQEQTRKN